MSCISKISARKILEIYNYINEYINTIFSGIKGYEQNFKAFQEIESIFLTFGYTPDIGFLSTLISNNHSFRKIIEQILKENEKKVITETYSSKSVILNTVIDAYWNVKNIEIELKDDNKKESNDYDGLMEYLREIRKIPLLTDDQERELLKKIETGDESAVKELVEHNLRLVILVARNYLGKGLPFKDLIQEGNLGLIEAAKKFNSKKGKKFSTYATYEIKYRVMRAIQNTGRIIRIPIYTQAEYKYYNATLEKLEKKLGRYPTEDEIENAILISPERIRELHQTTSDILSFDKEICSIPSEERLEEEVIEGIMQEKLKQELEMLFEQCKLTEEERYVIAHSFGLDGAKIMTLQAMGDKYGVSRERIRKIKDNVLEKLGYDESTETLAYFLDNPEKALKTIRQLRNNEITPPWKSKTPKVKK